jgi:hypothetical protein
MIKIKNFTPHVIRTQSGAEFEPDGIARLSTTFKAVKRVHGEIFYDRVNVLELPPPRPGVFYIVSAITLAVAKSRGREDCISPAVFHPRAVRNKYGKVQIVPGFIF